MTGARLRLRLILPGGLMLGPGKADLLAAIRDTGSIAAAGRSMGMSYKRAWMLVETLNAGFRTPLYEQGIGVPGCHTHFVTDDRTAGGHVLDFKLRSGTAALCLGTDLRLQLPLTDAFRNANLAPDDLEWQIQKTEMHA